MRWLEKTERYEEPEAVALVVTSEDVLSGSNEGGWAPVNDGDEK